MDYQGWVGFNGREEVVKFGLVAWDEVAKLDHWVRWDVVVEFGLVAC